MYFTAILSLLSSCFPSNKVVPLPEDLVRHILVEYLSDQPQNRLVSKKVRDSLDRKYDKISGYRGNRQLINLEAVMKLKSKRYHSDLRGYLSEGDVKVRRMAVKLAKELGHCYTIEIRVLIRLLKDSRSISQYYAILSLANYKNFFALKSTPAYRNLAEEERSELEEWHFKLLTEDRTSKYIMSYCRGYSCR